MIRFKYRKENIGILGKSTPRPVAQVYLQADSGRWHMFQPYIDSGADTTLLPYYVGKAIGLNEKDFKVSTLGGVAGETKVIYTKVKMKIGEKEFGARVAWSMENGVPLLLGRADIFNKFKITFDEKKEEIIFEEN